MVNGSVTHKEMHLDDAYTFCFSLDQRARVIEIYTEEQLDFLNIILSRYLKAKVECIFSNSIADHDGSFHYWLGGSDLAREGDWKWLNSGEPVPNFIWNRGQISGLQIYFQD